MKMLSRKGDAIAEGERIGKAARKLAFDCDFDDDCVYNGIDRLLKTECAQYERLDFVSAKECENQYILLDALYIIQKRNNGKRVSDKEFNKAVYTLRASTSPIRAVIGQ